MNIAIELLRISTVSTERIDYHTIIFKAGLPKRVDIDNSKDLWAFLKTLVAGGALKIYIDLSGVEYIDSSGIGVLINTAKLMRKQNGDIVLANATDPVRDIFKVINLENFIKICGSEVEALKQFQYV